MRYSGPSKTTRRKFIPSLNEDSAEGHARILKALGDPTRLKILNILSRHEGEVSVFEIVESFDLEQPTISFHLNRLRSVGLVSARKAGLFSYYFVRKEALKEVTQFLAIELVEPLLQEASETPRLA